MRLLFRAPPSLRRRRIDQVEGGLSSGGRRR